MPQPSSSADGRAVVRWVLLGVLLGIVAFGLVRLAALPPTPATHYHANWAVVVNGQRVDLSGNRYMEDVASCRVDPTRVEPADRVHMHNNNADVVHVHAAGATWGHLLANLNFGVGDDYLVTDRGTRYASGAAGTLKFVLNGALVPTIRNRVVGNEDRLLISYGAEPAAEVLRTQYPRVASTAGAFNSRTDPAACAGSGAPDFDTRLRRAFWR